MSSKLLKKALNIGTFGLAGTLQSPKAPMSDTGAQLEADKKNALFNFGLNNNKTNIFGSQNVKSDGNGGWMTTQTYAQPIQQAITGNLNLLPDLQRRIGERLSQPGFDPMAGNTRQEVMDAMLSRMNFGADEESLRTRLANQGLTEGSEGWAKEMDRFNQAKNDARMQALINSGTEMTNLFNLDQAGRMAPINELNAVSGSAQGMAPDFGFTPITANLSNPVTESYQEALDRYNAKQATRNQVIGGLFNLAAASVGGR